MKFRIYAKYTSNWVHLHCLREGPSGVMTSHQPLPSGQVPSSSAFQSSGSCPFFVGVLEALTGSVSQKKVVGLVGRGLLNGGILITTILAPGR